MSKLPSRKRCIIAAALGLASGVLCAWLASQKDPAIFDLKSFTFWSIVWNRYLIGLTIALAGAYRFHPLFGFRIVPALRGAILGAIVSLALAFGALITPAENAAQIFWLTVGVGALYGLTIDLIATKIGGEGKGLLK
ncbi:MAG: hypothetical protein K9L85_02350 [Candidatus Peribacteraceae bacterium]|nr:hypothetical protein [Candidatus Peribacteraceae bacterium]